MYQPVKRFAANTEGRDFVVGDIHGCFTKLRHELFTVDFDPDKDRLFSVGDLVDRGPESEEAAFYLDESWFHAVRGNHEQMAIGVAEGRHDLGNYLANGGGWFLALDDEGQRFHAEAFSDMPYAVEVEMPDGRMVGIVHADVAGNDWTDFRDALCNPASNNKMHNLREIALWSRSRIQAIQSGYPIAEINGIDLVLVGHTPLDNVSRFANIVYTDTGAVFGGKLSVIEISSLLTAQEN